MTSTQDYQAEIASFSARYQYDMSYQEELLASAPEAFRVFVRAQGTSGHRRALSLEAHYCARIAMMLAEDCRDCSLVNLRMAVEEGVERSLLEAVLWRPDELSAELQDVRAHAFDVAAGPEADGERMRRLRDSLGDEGFAELGVCLAGCRLFTTVKRSLGKAHAGMIHPGDF